MHVLQVMKSAVAVPQSIPGLVTKDILVMTFLEGEQISRLKVKPSALQQQTAWWVAWHAADTGDAALEP